MVLDGNKLTIRFDKADEKAVVRAVALRLPQVCELDLRSASIKPRIGLL
jgi:hypothetical protein